MQAAGLDAVDLWIGTGGLPFARLVAPVIKPRAYLPVHWDGLWAAFHAGPAAPFSDPELEAWLAAGGVTFVQPRQYMDKWRLDRTGVTPVENKVAKRTLGFDH